MYHEEILENYKEPMNYGLLENATHKRKELNPTCGDTFEFSLYVDEAGVVQEVGFEGEGCAISTASASLLSEFIKGKAVQEVAQLETEDVLELLGVELTPTRLKCALLPLQAVTRIGL